MTMPGTVAWTDLVKGWYEVRSEMTASYSLV